MVIETQTQVLIQRQHCDVTGLLPLLRQEKRLKVNEYESHKVSRDYCGFMFCFIWPNTLLCFEGISCLHFQEGKEATKRWCLPTKLHGVTYRTAVTAITVASMTAKPWQSTRDHKQCRSVMRIEFISSEEATDVTSVPVSASCGKDHRWRKTGDTADRNGRKWIKKVYSLDRKFSVKCRRKVTGFVFQWQLTTPTRAFWRAFKVPQICLYYLLLSNTSSKQP